MTGSKMRSLVFDLATQVSQQPDKVALLDANQRVMTYLELSKQIESAQAWLSTMDLQPGDTVIALLPNAMETVVLFLACLYGGYTYAPLPCTATLAEVIQWKTKTRARACLLANSLNTQFQDKIAELDWPIRLVTIGEKNMPWPRDVHAKAKGDGKLLMASSGSTGEPKAMVLDADRLWSAGHAFIQFHGIAKSDIRFWNYLPMSYLGGLFNLTLIPLAAGGSIYIDEAFSGKTFLFFWSTVERFNINSLWLVPTILRGLLTLANNVGQGCKRPTIHHCFLGTAPVSLAEKQRFAEVFGIQPLENYGLSETTFISSEHNQSHQKEGSVGSIMPDVDIKFVASEVDEVAAAEIWVRTPYVMLGYLNQEGLIESAVDEEGYLPTGDCGQIVDGQLQLSGRHRDIIKKGGILIVLREIEILAESYPQVDEAIAVKVSHDFYGESYHLYIRTVACEPEKITLGLEKWLHENVVRHKWPEKIMSIEEFPRTTSGKVRKHLLAARSAAHA